MMSLVRRLFDHPRLLLAACALFWAGNFVLARAMHESIPPIALAFWRWTVACALILPFAWRPLRRQWPLIKAHLGRMFVLAVLGVSGYNTLVYLGLQTTSATSSVLIQSTLPVLILLLNWLVFRAPFHALEVFSVLLSLCGVVVIMTGGDPMHWLQGNWGSGELWVLTAVLVWALYTVLLRWRPEGLDPMAFLGFILPAGWLVLVPLYVIEHHYAGVMHWNPSVVATVFYVAAFPSALAYIFWNRGVAAIGANAAGHIIHLMPVFGTLMAAVFLGERFTFYHMIGASLVATGIALTWRRGQRV